MTKKISNLGNVNDNALLGTKKITEGTIGKEVMAG
jgi:hypothetical protein